MDKYKIIWINGKKIKVSSDMYTVEGNDTLKQRQYAVGNGIYDMVYHAFLYIRCLMYRNVL